MSFDSFFILITNKKILKFGTRMHFMSQTATLLKKRKLFTKYKNKSIGCDELDWFRESVCDWNDFSFFLSLLLH